MVYSVVSHMVDYLVDLMDFRIWDHFISIWLM